MGNLTRDPEMRVTSGGLSICKFGLAVTRKFTSNGEQKEETAFVDIDSFGRQAETISKYLTKGRPIFVEGRLRFDQWESQSGEKRSKLSVVLENFQFLNSRQEGGNAPAGGEPGGTAYEQSSPPPRTTASPAKAAPAAAPDDDIDEDVPF